ncbi:putative leucine-rich repeat-containing protein DDB_G0290503 isoform X2 [Planococcus citri]|uniref:putative leucine-rich repeat-containing protein DDB_G0290503 isoform X2 n=1 Tax=Planococcus citri TaxID=170843 RepID=UPI0031F7D9E0
MDGNPGISLFQNSEFNRLEYNLPEPEELEADEDEKRRNEELKEMMQNAFDDLEDESHSVVTSYYDSSHGCESNFRKHPKDQKHLSNESPVSIPNFSPRYRSPGYDNYQQLQVLYEVRLREIDQLRNDFESFKESSNKEKAYFSEKVDLLEAEKQRTLVTLGESQKTLVETKTRLSTAEKDLQEWKSRYSEAENLKNKALHELEMCKLANREMEQRLVVAEKNVFRNEDKNFDIFLKEVNSKHKREMADLQKQITSLSNKLMAKENECLKLEHQLLDLQRIHESMLVEKTEIINKLTSNLEESQSQCHKLISNSTNHDTVKLLNQLRSQKSEINSLSIQVTALKKERNQLAEHLQRFKSEKISHYNSIQNESREEIQELERKLQEISLENKNLKETISINDSNANKKNNVLKIIEDNVTADLKQQILKLESELEESVKECDNVKKMYIEVCVTKDSLLKQNSSIEKEVADLKKEKNEMNGLIQNLIKEKEQLIEKLNALETELNDQKEKLETIITSHEDELRKVTEKHIHELDNLKLSLKNEFSKNEVFHQDQLSKLELECAKKILEIESSHKTQLLQMEANVKEEAVRICSEEIQILSDSYKKQYDELILRSLDLEHRLQEKTANYDSLKKQMDALKSFEGDDEKNELKKLRANLKNIQTKYDSDLVEWNEKLAQSNEKYEKLRADFQEVYNKYKKARKAATTMKETLEERNRYFSEKHAQYMQTIKDISYHLNDIPNFNSG